MQDRYLRTGIFLAPFHALDENPTLAIERDMELVEHLDRLNYHEAWIGEHHSGGFEIIACPEMFMRGRGQRTRNIRLGTGVVSLPYHHPVHPGVAHDAARPHGARRAMFGVGPGALIYDADKIGPEGRRPAPPHERIARLHHRADAGRQPSTAGPTGSP
jgi:limonene 1,2-monooxygenase